MRKLLTIIPILFLSFNASTQNISVYDLSCEHKINPLGMDAAQPRLSWKIASTERNTMQASYTIRVATDSLFHQPVWQSGTVNSGASILQSYRGPSLHPATRYYWQVKVRSRAGKESSWSDAAWWETGLTSPGDWKATWIEPIQDTVQKMPALLVRKTFAFTKTIASARIYMTAHGLYELSINGNKASADIFTPGWTDYTKRLQYQVYDVTTLLHQGNNVIGCMLGDGWYRGSLGWGENWGRYGKKLGLICQLSIHYTDGSDETVSSDGSWKGSQDGPIVLDGIYDGEQYDARKEMKGWNTEGFDDSRWKKVLPVNYSLGNLIYSQSVPVQRIQELTPIKIFRTPHGTLVADMGQNMVGWVRLKVQGSAGTVVTLRHAEVLDKTGEIYTENLRAATATIKYTLKGEGTEVYEPHFTFMGFRYVAIDNYPGTLRPEDITGIVIHSAMQPTGNFECSNPLLNQLQHNIQWGQKGNFLDVPTDCPQRDERLGWTGDAQAFSSTAAFNMDVSGFFTKWMKDLAADQYPDGRVPVVIPDILRNGETSAGWADVALIVPMTVYQAFGDSGILQSQYASMKAYVDFMRSRSGSSFLYKGGSIYGDWLFYKSMQQKENDGYTDPDMIATMFFAHSADLLSQVAAVLGKKEDALFYRTIFAKVKAAFNKNYVTGEGRIFSDSQTSYVLALMFGLLPETMQSKAVEYLVADIRSRHNHLSTGFLGTPYLCRVLSQNGRADVAYDLLLQQTFPSWLYPVKMGATTIWERWDGERPDSTFQDKGMNSFNHYAYGAIGNWMYNVVAGLEAGSPGYKHILIHPQPDKRLTHAMSSYESSYGKIVSGWQVNNGRMTITVVVPPNTSATVTLPLAVIGNVRENGVPIKDAVKNVHQNAKDVVAEIGSGEYRFEYDNPFH